MAADKLKWRVNRAIRDSRLPAPARLIMFVLSDRANADTGVIPDKNSPSLKDLAHDTGLNKATIVRQLPELERLGWVVCGRPNSIERATHATTTYRIQVGSEVAESDLEPDDPKSQGATPPRSQRATSKKNPRSHSATGEVAESDLARSQGATSYIKDDDQYDQNDQNDRVAADAAQPALNVELPQQRKRPGGTRKTAKAKEPDEFDAPAQELTTAFVERYKGRNIQKFVAIRGVVKTALSEGVPRDVLAHAMDAVVASGFAISGTTLSTELTRMWNAANGIGSRSSAMERTIREGAERAERMRERDEAEARGEHIPSLLSLPPGRAS